MSTTQIIFTVMAGILLITGLVHLALAYRWENGEVMERAWGFIGIASLIAFFSVPSVTVKIFCVPLFLRGVYEFYWRYKEKQSWKKKEEAE